MSRSSWPAAGEKAAWPIAELKRFPGNARRGDVETIKASLERLGQYRPIVVNVRERTRLGAGTILAGNHTRDAAEQLEWDAIECVFVDVDDATAELINVTDNRTAERGDYDVSALIEQIQRIGETDADLVGTGWDRSAIDALIARTERTPGKVKNAGRTSRKQDRKIHEIEPLKLGHRLEAAAFARPEAATVAPVGRALELFAGDDSSALTYWYRRIFADVVRVDRDEAAGADHTMPAAEYLRRRLLADGPFDFVDLDADGCPWEELDALFEALEGAGWPAFVLTQTDGQMQRIKFRAAVDFARDYRHETRAKKATRRHYDAMPELLTNGVVARAKEVGLRAETIAVDSRAGIEIYGSWMIAP